MEIANIAFCLMTFSLAGLFVGYIVKAIRGERSSGAVSTALLCALALAFSLFREFWLSPVLASGPAYLALVSIAVLLLNLFLVGLAIIVCLTD